MTKKYYRAAKKIHRYQYPDLNEEESAFCDFKNELRVAGGVRHKVFQNQDFYVTSFGQWLVPPVRFTGREDKSGHYNDWQSNFWRHRGAITLKRAKFLIQNYVKYIFLSGNKKPLSILLSQRVYRRNVNHTTSLILFESGTGELRAIQKDSNKIKRATASSFAQDICRFLGINYLLVVGRLPGQRKPAEGACLKEAFKIVGKVLDGKYPSSLLTASPEFTFTYNIKEKKVMPQQM